METTTEMYDRLAPVREASRLLVAECSDRSTSPERLAEIAREIGGTRSVRAALALAANPSTPANVVGDFATGWNLAELRLAAVKNPSCPTDVIAGVARNDRSEKVRKAALKRSGG
ncbi:MAG: hypothetical protein ACYCST_10115 [Acidimicrobiales bacterium]